ncbi:MAG TPA: glycosyltransferase, partial [Polyangiaceae bacterium]|nr:glycosyltransferase [Polyangiaceae bacterium]
WCARQTSHAEIVERYRWADVVVVPLKANRHASGITAVLEAVFLGKPVVASDTGGIDWYFDRDQLALCPVGEAAALRRAVEMIAENPAEAERRARAAQAAVTRKNLTSKGYDARHVALTEELLATPQSAR